MKILRAGSLRDGKARRVIALVRGRWSLFSSTCTFCLLFFCLGETEGMGMTESGFRVGSKQRRMRRQRAFLCAATCAMSSCLIEQGTQR